MKSILVLTDFSESSINAAKYIAALSAEIGPVKIVLYHSFLSLQSLSEIPLPSPSFEANIREKTLIQLGDLKKRLAPLLPGGTTIDVMARNDASADELMSFIDGYPFDLIVMGTTGKGAIERMLLGSFTVQMIRNCRIPLLIVPPHAAFQPVENIVFACDLKDVHNTPVSRIKAFTDQFNARLHILSISPEGDEFKERLLNEQKMLHEIWDSASPAYHYISGKDAVGGIMKFLRENNADLAIAVRKQRGFFESLFHKSVSSELAHHTWLPLLILNEVR